MAREIQKTTIDGHLYEMTMLGATAGYRLFHRLFRMLGPSFGSLMDAASETRDVADLDLSSQVVVSAIKTLTQDVSEEDIDYVIEQLRGQTQVGINGSSKTVPLGTVFEAHFSGDIAAMFKWLFWGLKVQYSTFASAFANLKPPVAVGANQVAGSQSP